MFTVTFANLYEQIFCAHGGIPPPWIGNGMANIIRSIPCPLPKPEEQSKLAWELMWSDPIHSDTFKEIQKSSPQQFTDGFGLNMRRGTAHVFTDNALEAFLTRNNFSHVVRAHEVQQAGFQVSKLWTTVARPDIYFKDFNGIKS